MEPHGLPAQTVAYDSYVQYHTVFLAIRLATSSIRWLPFNLIDLLVCPLSFPAGSVADSILNTLLWPGMGTVAGQISSRSDRFSTAAQKQWKTAPCRGLVNISASISLVGQYSTATSFDWIQSVTKKYWILMWHVRWLLECFPFFSSRIVL